MNLSDVMQAVADQLVTITGLRVYGYPADKVTPPVAVVGYPESYTFDVTYGRGMDQLELPVWVAVRNVSERAARDKLAPYVSGSGASSVKQVVESGTYTAFDSCRVARVEFEEITVGDVGFLAAKFFIDIVGSGAV